MKKLAKKQIGGDSTKVTSSYIKKDLKKAMQDSAAARKYIKTNRASGNMSQDVMEKKLALMKKPYEIRKAANDSAGVKTPPYKDISKGSYWNKKKGGTVKTKSKK